MGSTSWQTETMLGVAMGSTSWQTQTMLGCYLGSTDETTSETGSFVSRVSMINSLVVHSTFPLQIYIYTYYIPYYQFSDRLNLKVLKRFTWYCDFYCMKLIIPQMYQYLQRADFNPCTSDDMISRLGYISPPPDDVSSHHDLSHVLHSYVFIYSYSYICIDTYFLTCQKKKK